MGNGVYYFANKEYQYSHGKSVYTELGGRFVARDTKHYLRFKWYFRHWPESQVIIHDFQSNPLAGVLISMSNTKIPHDSQVSTTLFLGHGSGDKRYGGSAENLLSYDFLFVSGEKQIAKLKDEGLEIPEEKLVKVGNPRFDAYVKGELKREAISQYLGIKDPTRKTILYAPTWRWGNGSLLSHYQLFCERLTPEYNLIIRPHFHDRRLIPKMRAWIWANKIRNVYFSNPASFLQHDTMEAFAISDLLISDTSSTAYEYLITGNPVVIVETGFKDLHPMPPELNIHSIATRFEKNTSSPIETVVQNAISQHARADYEQLRNNCYYFNDGKSTGRIVDFIHSLPTFQTT